MIAAVLPPLVWTLAMRPTPPPRALLSIASAPAMNMAAVGDSDLPLASFSDRAILGALGALLASLAIAAMATRSPPQYLVAREVLAGGLAAALGEAIFYPVEVAKVRLQATRKAEAPLSLIGELAKQLRGGVHAWAAAPGVVAGVLRALIYHGLRLGLFSPIKRYVAVLAPSGGLPAQLLVGAGCGALGAALCNPFDLVKARMAAAPAAYPNSIAAIAAIAKREGGATKLWRGAPATTLRAALGSGAQLVTYGSSKRLVASLPLPKGYGLSVLLATCASAAAYVTAAAPADVVRTRCMMVGSDGDEEENCYASALDCLTRSVREEGLFVLFRGWGASFARLLPVLLLVFPLLEKLRVAFGVGSF